jgi:hypothetical protein
VTELLRCLRYICQLSFLSALVPVTTYKQRVKNKVRNFLIKQAVVALTKRRQQSLLVTKEGFEAITTHFNDLLLQALRFPPPEALAYRFRFEQVKREWYQLYDAVCLPKKAAQLKVLYLAGPEPLNDIQVLVKNGILLANIWAVEAEKSVYQAALNELKANGVQIKLHRGSLKEFFEQVPHEFDIVYFDSCSPLVSPNANPVETLAQLFLNKRLTGLSVLITNFSEPRENLDWGQLMAPWFIPRRDDAPAVDHECYLETEERADYPDQYAVFIRKHLPAYYDKFITHFIACLAAEMVPMWQSLSLSSVRNTQFLQDKPLRQLLADLRHEHVEVNSLEEWIIKVHHHLLAVAAYPLLNWVRLARQELDNAHPLRRFLETGRGQISLGDTLYVYSLLKRFEENGFGLNTSTAAVCSPELRTVLADTDFFDRNMRLTTDTPMKNLLVDLLYGAYGYPHLANAGVSAAIKYQAKDTAMYSNLFVFDQCRYLYDFLPTMELLPDFFKDPLRQVIIRGCIDGIHRNHFTLNPDVFRWGFVEDLGDPRFRQSHLADRVDFDAPTRAKPPTGH